MERLELLIAHQQMNSKEQYIQQTGTDLTLKDLISKDETEFWKSLCKRDFKRLQKLMNKSLGEGHFMDDSDEFDSDNEKQSRFRNRPGTAEPDNEDENNNDYFGMLYHGRGRSTSIMSGDNKDDDDDDDDLNKGNLLSDLLANMNHNQEKERLIREQKELEEKLEREKQ